MHVAVLGASGPVGAAAVRAALAHPAAPTVTAVTRTPPGGGGGGGGAAAPPPPWPIEHPRLRVVGGSAAAAAALTPALAPVDALFVSTPPSPHVAAWLPAVVDAAAAAGVHRVAVLSVLRRDGSAAAYGEWFRSTEAALGVGCAPPAAPDDRGNGRRLPSPSLPLPPRRPRVCVLRAAMFFENLLAAAPAVRSTGVLVGVAPATAVTPYVAVADIGAAAAAVLLTVTPPSGAGEDASWPHTGAVYELIGDAPDYAAVAAALATVVARPPGGDSDGGDGGDGGSGGGGGDARRRRPPVVYEQVDEAAAVAAAVAAGAPEWTARSLTELAAATAAGRVHMATASGDLARLLGGRGGVTVAEWVASTAALWAPPPM